MEKTEFQHFGRIFLNWGIIFSQSKVIVECCQQGLMLCSSFDRILPNDMTILSIPMPI